MNDIVRTLATPVSPLMVSIVNNPPAPVVAPSGYTELSPQQHAQLQAAVDRAQTTLYVWSAVSVVSAFAAGYHGAKRNNGSVGYGLLWGFAGGLFPIVVPAIAIAQGYAKPER
jgi:uncharacterized membrane protein (DUF485 family)